MMSLLWNCIVLCRLGPSLPSLWGELPGECDTKQWRSLHAMFSGSWEVALLL